MLFIFLILYRNKLKQVLETEHFTAQEPFSAIVIKSEIISLAWYVALWQKCSVSRSYYIKEFCFAQIVCEYAMKTAYKKKVTDLQLQNVILLSQKKITEGNFRYV